jgi:uncharacterized protein (DUF1778 family)
MRTGSGAPQRETLNLRITTDLSQLIDRAAAVTGRNPTDFILEAARRGAEDILLDRSALLLRPKAHSQFLARLDAPPRPNKRLLRTMRTPAPWE